MPVRKAEIHGIAIVLVGRFNPAIFHPAWFAAENLIRKKEAEETKVELIHSEVSAFSFEWCDILVTQERFQALTTQESAYELMRDLVIGAFTLLRHTPIKYMGINEDSHFRIESTEDWNAFGDRLAPKTVWTECLDDPGLMRMTMQEKPRRDGQRGFLHVTVGSSEKIPQGIYVGINDHYEVDNSDGGLGSDKIIDILKTSWNDSLQRSSSITKSLMDQL